jgi:hypothetical protein
MVQGFIAGGVKTGFGIIISYDSYFEWLIHFGVPLDFFT